MKEKEMDEQLIGNQFKVSYIEDNLHACVIEEEIEPELEISMIDRHQQFCCGKLRKFISSGQFIVVFSKFVVILTGMIGPLLLEIQEDCSSQYLTITENIPIQTETCGNAQLPWNDSMVNRNDHPFQKGMIIQSFLVLFLFVQSKREKKQSNERDYILKGEDTLSCLKDPFRITLVGLLKFAQLQTFIVSLGYTSVLRSQLFTGVPLFILTILKWREGVSIYSRECLAIIMALGVQIFIALWREAPLDTLGSFLLGDMLALIGGILGSMVLFLQYYKRQAYYRTSVKTNLIGWVCSIICVFFFDKQSILLNTTNVWLLAILVIIQCIAHIKKIKTFVFIKYFKNIFEPIIAFKYELIFGLKRLDSWTFIVIFILLYVPANFIMLKSHADDIKANLRHRDSTFVDVLNFEEYIEMRELTTSSHNIKHQPSN